MSGPRRRGRSPGSPTPNALSTPISPTTRSIPATRGSCRWSAAGTGCATGSIACSPERLKPVWLSARKRYFFPSMAGLGPAIHDLYFAVSFLVDARPEAGHERSNGQEERHAVRRVQILARRRGAAGRHQLAIAGAVVAGQGRLAPGASLLPGFA